MAYRRTEKVERRLAARRDAILAAARSLAAEDGMAAVQIAAVAARAGVAAGTVYRYFRDKTELVATLIEAVSQQELAALRAAAASGPGPSSALAAAIVTFASRALAERKLAFAVLAEPVDADAGPPRLGYRSALAAEFEARIRAAIAAAHLPEQDAALAATALLGALLEGLIGPLAVEVADDATARERVQTLSLFGLRGLGLPDARARGLVVQVALPPREAALEQS
jgi:AcrR family transcriptional regulator